MNESWFEKIEDYLNGKMSREERLLFELELGSNKELHAAFQLYQDIETEMSNQEKYSIQEAELNGLLENLNNRYILSQQPAAVIPMDEKPGRVRKIQPWKSIAIAAGIIGLIFLGTIWYMQDIQEDAGIAVDSRRTDTASNHSHADTSLKSFPIEVTEDKVETLDEKKNPGQEPVQEKTRKGVEKVNEKNANAEKLDALFADNFEPDTVPDRRAGPLQSAFVHYENAEFENAITAIENADLNIVTRGSKADEKLVSFYKEYYLGLSYLAINQKTKAVIALEKALTNSPDASCKNKAQWYLSLAYLKTGKLDKIENLLNQLARDKKAGIYQNKAVKLQDELEENKLK
jgi:tetratricopeptide (TPR) repeat protein